MSFSSYHQKLTTIKDAAYETTKRDIGGGYVRVDHWTLEPERKWVTGCLTRRKIFEQECVQPPKID